MPVLWHVLTSALAVQFGKQNTWSTPPIAKITVTARGAVCTAAVKMHVIEAKNAVMAMLKKHKGVEDDICIDNISVEIHRRLLVDDEQASISTSMILSMTAGATTVMH